MSAGDMPSMLGWPVTHQHAFALAAQTFQADFTLAWSNLDARFFSPAKYSPVTNQ